MQTTYHHGISAGQSWQDSSITTVSFSAAIKTTDTTEAKQEVTGAGCVELFQYRDFYLLQLSLPSVLLLADVSFPPKANLQDQTYSRFYGTTTVIYSFGV